MYTFTTGAIFKSYVTINTPASKGKFNRYTEALGIGIRFIVIFEVLGPDNADTKVPKSKIYV